MKNYLYKIFLIIFCLTFKVSSYAQKFNVSGIVNDEKGEPIIGVTVYIKDSPGKGTITDLNGHFKLSVNRGDKVEFTYLGYTPYEWLVLKEENNKKVSLKPNVKQVDEVVVEAYGTKNRKITSTGAVTSVDVSTLQTPATSISNMLGGRVAGVISTLGSGEPGKNISEFWVRGIGTFGYNSGALVLIDGLEGNLNDVDPADVESFSVLKDASATAMYGIRGANGVVLVTTKRGRSEKMKFTARANASLSWMKDMPDYCGSYDYAKLTNEALWNRGEKIKYGQKELDIIRYGLDPDLYPNVNWRKVLLNNDSWEKTYYTSVEGGGSLANYFISLNYSNETSAYKQDKSSKYYDGVSYNTFGLRSNINLKLTKTSNLYVGTTMNKTFNDLPGQSDTNALWAAATQLSPLLVPVIYSNGAYPKTSSGFESVLSPYVALNYTGMTKKEYTQFIQTLSLDQDLGFITSGLKLNAQVAYTSQNWFNETRSIYPETWFYDIRDAKGDLSGTRQSTRQTVAYSSSQDQYRRYYLQSTLIWNRLFGEKHNLKALAHFEMSDDKTASQGGSSGMNAIPIRYEGLSGQVGYDYGDIYLLDFNFGYTGSENFQPGRQFGFFPSISGGWVPTSYEWTKKKFPWLNYFKIRASYGLVGNDRITSKRFPYLTSIGENDNKITKWNGTGTIWESLIGADNLRWEKAKKLDVGFEGKLFKKFDFTVDLYRDKRDGIFQQRTQVPDFVGLWNMPYGNVGSMVSWGSDGNITFTQDLNKDTYFTIRANYTYATNKVKYFEEADTKYEYNSVVGRPYGYQKGYIALGLFKDKTDIENSPTQTFGSYLPGDIKYKDVNGDGVINSDDQVPLSYSNYPRLMYGFGGEFHWKKITVNILFKGQGNTYFYKIGSGSDLGWMPFYGGQVGNILKLAANPAHRWIPADYPDASIPQSLRENANAEFPRLSYGVNANNDQLSTFWKANRRYLKLQEVSVYYRLDPPFLEKSGISYIDLALVGTNLITWSPEKMFDPDQATSNGLSYPIPGRVSFQLTVNF